ncbi:MAG: radical SAM protein [Clostridia bacterium]|nr:radical SAM protein [Clostridia bacterium]
MLTDCNLCSWHCNVDRTETLGVCKCGKAPKLALASVHYWEEPCISGTKGSGTVFFSGCNFKCDFCQNYSISQEGFGKEISIHRLAEIFLELQEQGVHNINLVSPTPYVFAIIEALDIAKKNGLQLPVVYNTNSYETPETIRKLNGYIDIYLPDLKYVSLETALMLSKVPNYFEAASTAIAEMVNQVGRPQFDKNGMMTKGVIIRHLVLPNHLTETKKVIEWVKENLNDRVYLSIMAQYFPTYKAKEHKDINRKLNKKEYTLILRMLENIENGYIQELGEFEEEYVPNFDLRGV